MPTPLGESLPLKSQPVLSRDNNLLPLHLAQRQQQEAAKKSGKFSSVSESELEDIPLSSFNKGNQFSKYSDTEKSRRHQRPANLSVYAPSADRTTGYRPPTSDNTLAPSEIHHLLTPRTPMGKKSPSAQSRLSPSDPAAGQQPHNGHATGAMTSPFLDPRRKHASLDNVSTTGAQYIRSERFSLDSELPPETPKTPSGGASAGFWELAPAERRNFLMLCLLYFMQGVPMGLATGSVPFLLKSHLSFGQIGVFSLASYPYSLKLLWSPIVDAVWSQRVGRRKSWIIPIQALSGMGMLWLGSRVERMMETAGENGGAGVWGFTSWWFFLVFMCATQDIAVDGWALVLLSPQNLSYASTAQTIGLTAGQFLSYTVFLAFNAPDFANKWLRASPRPEGVLTLGGYLTFFGWAYIAVTVGLAIMKKEDRSRNTDGIMEVYRIMGGILSLRNIQIFIFIHLIAKIGFVANDAVTNLKLLDKGFSQENLALTVLIDFPFELGLGYYAGKWSSIYPPMKIWCWAFLGRIAAAVFAEITISMFPANGVTSWYLCQVIAMHVHSTFMSTLQFVAVSAFHAKIADPVIGGTYMTLLATCSNLGGTFPRFFVLKFVDMFTKATCMPPSTTPYGLKEGVTPVTAPFSCVLEAEKHRCIEGGGMCNIEQDGYLIVNACCAIMGIISFIWFIQPQAYKLQALPLRAWRLASA
ncbi:MAG: hypothetical protein M1822_000940 [Bathelium mastoideum]|nr:MAG: hypothetical protein M1822_000940 [Bathelium mastoideum]